MCSGDSQAHRLTRIAAVGVVLYLNPVKRRWKALASIFGVTLLLALYWAPRDFLAKKVLQAPPLAVQIVSAKVRIGGECITVTPVSGPGIVATVCFYQDGYTIAAAHPVGLGDGPWPIAESRIAPAMIRGTPEFVTSTPYGMVLSGLGPSRESGELLEIGNVGDIALEQEAELRSSWKGTILVRILGYTLMRDGQFLVFQFCDSEQILEGGMSGSPIVQDGKIIGFATGHPLVLSLKRPQIGIARLATEVYLGIQPYLHATAAAPTRPTMAMSAESTRDWSSLSAMSGPARIHMFCSTVCPMRSSFLARSRPAARRSGAAATEAAWLSSRPCCCSGSMLSPLAYSGILTDRKNHITPSVVWSTCQEESRISGE